MTYFVDKNSPFPRYFQVFDSLKKRINDGEFSGENNVLPPERKLTAEYDVSRITIVKALDQLKNAGLVESQHGRGTFIKSRVIDDYQAQANTLNLMFVNQGLNVKWQMLEKGWLTSPPTVAEAFYLSSNEIHFRVALLLLIDNEPFGYYLTHLPRQIAIRHQTETMSIKKLVRFLKENAFVGKHAPRCIITSLGATKSIAETLLIRAGKPLMMLDMLYLNPEKQVQQYTRAYLKGDKFRFQC